MPINIRKHMFKDDNNFKEDGGIHSRFTRIDNDLNTLSSTLQRNQDNIDHLANIVSKDYCTKGELEMVEVILRHDYNAKMLHIIEYVVMAAKKITLYLIAVIILSLAMIALAHGFIKSGLAVILFAFILGIGVAHSYNAMLRRASAYIVDRVEDDIREKLKKPDDEGTLDNGLNKQSKSPFLQ